MSAQRSWLAHVAIVTARVGHNTYNLILATESLSVKLTYHSTTIVLFHYPRVSAFPANSWNCKLPS